MARVVAVANANLALAKYWGKRNEALNLPFTGSLSVCLEGLQTTAAVTFDIDLAADRIAMNDAPAAAREAERVSRFIDLVREQASLPARARVEVRSNFPVAAGLASSASTFAALALAVPAAAGLSLDERQLSILARRGSGSAARSIRGGFVEWLAGENDDGSDSYAVQIAPPDHWRLGIVVAVADEGSKKVGSREGMDHVVRRSPFFPAWLETHQNDLDAIRAGVLARDLEAVGRASEHNCLKMHAVSMAANPAIFYWNETTVAVMRRVRELREEGTAAYFTIDAGPQVKVICAMDDRARVAEALAGVAGVKRVILSEPGGDARLLEGPA